MVLYIHQILLIFINEPNVMQTCLYVLIMSLAKYECYVNLTFTLLCWRRGMSYRNVGVHSSQVGEVKYVQFIPQLAKSLLIKWLCEDVG